MNKLMTNLLKSFFSFALLGLLSFAPQAGQCQYKLFAETGYALNAFGDGYQGFSINIIQGITLGSSGFFLGVGTGMDIHTEVESSSLFAAPQSFASIPLYLDMRFALIQNSFGQQYSGLYYYCDGGYTFPNVIKGNLNSLVLDNGLFVMTGVGGIINVGARDISLNLNLGYRFEGFKEITPDNEVLAKNIGSLCFKIGAIFKPGSN